MVPPREKVSRDLNGVPICEPVEHTFTVTVTRQVPSKLTYSPLRKATPARRKARAAGTEGLRHTLSAARKQGRLVEKSEFLNRLWPGSFVAEVGLAHAVSQLCKALRDGADGTSYIETVPKRG